MIDNRWQSALQRERGSLLEACQSRYKVYVNPGVCSRAYLNQYHGLSWFTQTISQSTSQLRVQSHLGIHQFLFILFRNWLKEFALPSWPIRCKTNVNCDLITHVFARFRQFACFPLKTHWLLVILIFVMIDCCDDFGQFWFHLTLNRNAFHYTGMQCLRYSIYGNLLLITI